LVGVLGLLNSVGSEIVRGVREVKRRGIVL
jgi:hypothetical protein